MFKKPELRAFVKKVFVYRSEKMKNFTSNHPSGWYMNYLMLGMINIIIASNMDNLSDRYGVTIAKISLLVSAIGIGKLIALFFVGRLSDGWGRKPVIITSPIFFIYYS